MIFDKIENAARYFSVSPRLEKGLRFLAENGVGALSAGKYVIDGENVYASVDKYDTKPIDRTLWEIHKKYIDIQFVIEGAERVGLTDAGTLALSRDFLPGGDMAFLTGDAPDFPVLLAGWFLILFPGEAHLPGRQVEEGRALPVKKAIVKVLAE